MKKLLFDLQLFADDAGTDTSGADGADGTNSGTGQNTDQHTNNKADAALKYTDDDVNKIISQKKAEWQKKKDKEIDEAKKLADMNAQQKAEYERDKLQKELDELKRANSLSEMAKAARKMLADDHNINLPDELLSHLVTVNAEETKTAVDGFAKLFKAAVDDAVKEKTKGTTPKTGTGTGKAAMTKEQVMSIKDPELRQQKILENKHLFNF